MILLRTYLDHHRALDLLDLALRRLKSHQQKGRQSWILTACLADRACQNNRWELILLLIAMCLFCSQAILMIGSHRWFKVNLQVVWLALTLQEVLLTILLKEKLLRCRILLQVRIFQWCSLISQHSDLLCLNNNLLSSEINILSFQQMQWHLMSWHSKTW